jgi:hypothetical protein
MNAFGSAVNPHAVDTQAWDNELDRRVAERVDEALADPVVLADMAEDYWDVRKALAEFIFIVHQARNFDSVRTARRGFRPAFARALREVIGEEMMEEGKG